MGYRLVTDLMLHGGAMPGAAYKVVHRMAHTARDDDDSPAYWAGHGPLALVLGKDVPADQDDTLAARRARKRAKDAVGAAVSAAIAWGAISVDARPAPGHNTRYLVHPQKTRDPDGERSGETSA